MAESVFARPVQLQAVQSLGPYQLKRFVSLFELEMPAKAHIGELLLGDSGRLAYLKTFALTHAQIQRGWYLQRLDATGSSTPRPRP